MSVSYSQLNHVQQKCLKRIYSRIYDLIGDWDVVLNESDINILLKAGLPERILSILVSARQKTSKVFTEDLVELHNQIYKYMKE